MNYQKTFNPLSEFSLIDPERRNSLVDPEKHSSFGDLFVDKRTNDYKWANISLAGILATAGLYGLLKLYKSFKKSGKKDEEFIEEHPEVLIILDKVP